MHRQRQPTVERQEVLYRARASPLHSCHMKSTYHQSPAGEHANCRQPYLVTVSASHRHTLLRDHAIARNTCRTIHSLDEQGITHTWCFVSMPDHCQWLFTLDGPHSLAHTLRKFKTQSSRMAGVPLWRRTYQARSLRRDTDLLPTARYVVASPLRAGLVTRLGDYPYWNAVWL